MQIEPGETILHADQRRHGDYPRRWRILAAANGILDPFQAADASDTYRPAAGTVLQPYQELADDPFAY